MPDWLTACKYPALVFVGGGAGAVLRFLLGKLMPAADGRLPFPWITFGINVVGSFVLGVVAVLCVQRPGWKAFLGAGLCGGFTTFSAFSVEILTLMEEERYAASAGYVLGSVLAGLLGAWLGVRLGRTVG